MNRLGAYVDCNRSGDHAALPYVGYSNVHIGRIVAESIIQGGERCRLNNDFEISIVCKIAVVCSASSITGSIARYA
jgi:hypothetical protein